MLIGHYSNFLAFISLCVAILASYTALDMTGRIATAKGRDVYFWMIGGALAMGVGIWSMHFIGMLAFHLPIKLAYDLSLTALSLLIAVVSSGFALWLVSQPRIGCIQLGLGALFMGVGIASMHYIGMAALLMLPGIDYSPTLFGASVAVAVGASAMGLWIAIRLRKNTPHVRRNRCAAAVLIGIAIVGMHYIGMAAANFPEGSYCNALSSGLSGGQLYKVVVMTSLLVLIGALLLSLQDYRFQIRTAEMSDALLLANQELTHQALHDKLTHLPNRTLLYSRIEKSILKVKEKGGCFALIFIDLDGFKAINDAFGHDVGDKLLKEVASRLRGHLHEQETLARIGGDEFVLLIDLQEPSNVSRVADKQIRLLSKSFLVDDYCLQISASMGVAFCPDHGLDLHELLSNADAAMYHAKELGKNGYCIFDSPMKSKARHQLQMLQDLRVAVDQKQLRLYYQPKFEAQSGELIGAEALLRWQHPVSGLLLPSQFIGLAEKTNLIIPIGNWVLFEACRQMREWLDQGYENWRISVNLSAVQFCHKGLVATVTEALASHALHASSLTLEVTETIAMRDAEESLVLMGRLADMGVDLSIDDFGTGYSSLMYLKRLPVNELKIDRGFVRDLKAGSEDEAIVLAIITLGKKMGLRIVAEGVENEQQRQLLIHLGCDSLQGYLLGRPVPAELFI